MRGAEVLIGRAGGKPPTGTKDRLVVVRVFGAELLLETAATRASRLGRDRPHSLLTFLCSVFKKRTSTLAHPLRNLERLVPSRPG